MRIISKGTLRDFWQRHAGAENALREWYQAVKGADWNTPAELKMAYPSASIIAGNRAVFNIGGNNYRLVAHINYRRRQVYIRFVGTHAEYDRIDAAEV